MPGGGARVQNLGHLYFASKFWLKFLYWCISHELNIRNHSYLDYRYPIGLALFLWFWTPGSMPGGGARVQNLGHL